MLDKTKKRDEKTEITIRSLYGNSLFVLIQSAIFCMLFLCGFIAVVLPFYKFPVLLRLMVGIIALFLFLAVLFELLAAAKELSKIKSSNLKITDAVIVEKYKRMSGAPEDLSDVYYIKIKCDEGIKEMTVDSFLYDQVKFDSHCYYFNVSDAVYPKDYYFLGDDLIPYYSNKNT